MAKGRRFTNSRNERLLGLDTHHYGQIRHVQASHVADLAEEEVWSMVDATTSHNSLGEWTPHATIESGRRREWEREVTRQDGHGHVGGLSMAIDDKTTSSRNRIVHQFGVTSGGPRGDRHMATSAPVNVPDWSKILRVDSAELMHDSDEFDRVGDSGVEPPHEYLARSRKMNAMSVFEGVGRTLKGRDMSRVRDAVWNQTGFEG